MSSGGASERVLVLAPRGRDALVAKGILREAAIAAEVCIDIAELCEQMEQGVAVALLTEEALAHPDSRCLVAWSAIQPSWSELPIVVLTTHGGGPERNPAAADLVSKLGNVSFLERPFHPTTLVSVVRTNIRARMRQYERRRLNENLEQIVQERTEELAVANRQLLAQIEERERVETTLRRMQRLEAVGQLTAGVAHDFNNLLTVVIGTIKFLEKEVCAANLSGKPLQRLSNMRIAAERGAKLTDQLLSFSRRQRLEPRSTDINETVGRMRDLLQSTMGGSVSIETRLARDLWRAMVDPTQIELAILNLAINARDAMEVGGSLTVGTSNITLGAPLSPEEPAPGEYVKISVADTGSGMTDEVRAKALEPFFTTKEVGKGSGLGLSQVLGFAQQTGGGIRIDTAAGRGTTISIFLPRAIAETAEEEKFGAPDTNSVLAGKTVLVVDDDPAVREVTAAMLREFGCAIIEAGSGAAALDALTESVDLALLDYAMPGMNGVEVARHITSKKPNLPILFVTGFADRALLHGVNDSNVVGKPFVDGELAEKARLALTNHQNIMRLRTFRGS